jgi:hypothetical protein
VKIFCIACRTRTLTESAAQYVQVGHMALLCPCHYCVCTGAPRPPMPPCPLRQALGGGKPMPSSSLSLPHTLAPSPCYCSQAPAMAAPISSSSSWCRCRFRCGARLPEPTARAMFARCHIARPRWPPCLTAERFLFGFGN